MLKTNTIPSAKPAAPATNSLPPAKRATLEANPVPAFALSDDEDWQSSEEYHNAEEMYEDSFGTMSDVDADAENDVVEVPHFGDSAEEEVEADEEDESPISDDSQPSSNDTGDTRPTFPETSDPFSSTAPSDNSGSGSGAESGAGSGGKPLGNEAKPEDTLENEAKPEESLGNESKPPETLGNQAASEETQGDKPDGPSKPGTEKPGWPSSGTSNSPWPSSANGTSKPNTGGNAKPPDHWLPNVNDPPKPITQTKTPWYNPWASNRPGLKGGDLIIDPDPPIMNHNPPIDPKTGQPIKDRGVGIGIALPLTTEQSTSSPPPNLTPGDVKYQQALPPVKDPPKSPSFEGSMKVKVTTDDKGTQLMNDAVDTVFGVNPMRVMEKGVQSLVDGIERASSWLPKPSKKSTDDQPSTSTPSKMASDGKTSYTDGNERSVAEKEAAQKRRQKRDEEFRQSEHGKQFHKKHSHEPSDPAAAEEWKKERRQAVEEYRHEKAVKKWERSSDSEAFIRQYGPKPTDPAELEKWEKHRNEAMNPIKLESTVTEGGIRA